jgi:integrase
MSVYRKQNGKWVAKVWSDGRWRWVGTFATKREARSAEQAASPTRSSTWGITVEQFCDTWLRDYARPASSSRSSYRYAIARLRTDFGARRLGSIERPEAQAWAKRVPYFSYRAARTMYADALRDGFVQVNPFAQLRIPARRGRRKLDVLPESEVMRLADTAPAVYDEHFGPTMRTLILVMGFAGPRPSEAAELEWGDVNLAEGLLTVRGTKTEAAWRTCVLPPPAAHALGALERHEDVQTVFLTPRGRKFGKGAFHRYFAPIRAAYGRPDLTPYHLRHACATLLLERGLSPEDVAAQLGHKDGGSLVRELYGHPDEQRQRDRIALAFSEVPAEPVADRSSGAQNRA